MIYEWHYVLCEEHGHNITISCSTMKMKFVTNYNWILQKFPRSTHTSTKFSTPFILLEKEFFSPVMEMVVFRLIFNNTTCEASKLTKRTLKIRRADHCTDALHKCNTKLVVHTHIAFFQITAINNWIPVNLTDILSKYSQQCCRETTISRFICTSILALTLLWYKIAHKIFTMCKF